MSETILLVCTVGGTHEAVVASVKYWQPQRVVFVVSPQTRKDVEDKIVPAAEKEGVHLSPGQWEYLDVPDAQDMSTCVERIRELDSEIEKWVKRGSDYQAVTDFTGGTKCMSVALALVARRWQCRFSYVGGTERTKGGVGIVVSGKEQVLRSENPWDSLGYQAVEDAIVLFDKGEYEAASRILEPAMIAVERPDLKGELNTLKFLCEAYQWWDRFDHSVARGELKEVVKRANNLRHLFPTRADDLLAQIDKHIRFLEQFKGKVGQYTIADLLANARRCGKRGRYDDGVARLYRAIEAVAQLRLSDFYGIEDTGKVSFSRVPESLRSQWGVFAKDDEVLALGLQKAYQLLAARGDNAGQSFQELGLAGEGSLLTSRNQSILAHGFCPVKPKVFTELWDKALCLAGTVEEELPEFPRLGQHIGSGARSTKRA